MYHPKIAEAPLPLGDHCVCHYPDSTTQTWLIHDDDDDDGTTLTAQDSKKKMTESSGSVPTKPGANEEEEDVIAVPLHYTRQGDAIRALYCDCFVVDEDDIEAADAAASHLFAGAVVLNHTSGGYDFVQLSSEEGGFARNTAMVGPPGSLADIGSTRSWLSRSGGILVCILAMFWVFGAMGWGTGRGSLRVR